METPSRHTYNLDGATRVFPVPSPIKGDNYCRIEVDSVIVNDRAKYDIVNNSIVFLVATDVPAGSVLDILVVQSEEAIGQLAISSNMDIVALNITDVNIVGANIADVNTIANNNTNVNIVATNIADVNTVATNIADINRVENSIDNLDRVHTSISNVDRVYTSIDNLDRVDTSIDKLDRVHTSIANVDTVANDLNEPTSEIETVATNIANVNTVGTGIANVNTVAANIANVNSVNANETNINAAVSNAANINSAVANATNITAAVANATNINAVVANTTNINAVATNEADIDSVALNIANVNSVASNATNINATVANATNINAVATNEADIDSVALNIASVTTTASSIADVSTVATDIADVSTVGTDIANVNIVATNLTDINAFATTYQIAAVAPSSPADGMLWYDTTSDTLRVYNGSSWDAAGSSVNGTESSVEYIATAGQTTFAAIYDVGYAFVYLNGILLAESDYTATNGTSITLNVAALVGDIVFIQSFGTFVLADHYTKEATDSLLQTALDLKVSKDSDTGAAGMPVGTTAQRPTAATGLFRFNSTDTTFEGYNGTEWGPLAGGGEFSKFTYEYIATAGQTTFSGSDLNGQTLAYTAGNLIVTYGGLDIPFSDYTATSGTSVVLADGALAGEIVRVIAFTAFVVADTYTQAQIDAKDAAIVTGGPSLGTDSVIRTNAKVIAENITFTGNENGSSVGPITVNSGFTVTVASGSTWVIL